MSRQPKELLLILQAWCDPIQPHVLQVDFDPSQAIPSFRQLLDGRVRSFPRRYVNSLLKHQYQRMESAVYNLDAVWFVIQCFNLLDMINTHHELCQSQDKDFAGGQQLIEKSCVALCRWLSYDPMCWQLCRFAQCFYKKKEVSFWPLFQRLEADHRYVSLGLGTRPVEGIDKLIARLWQR